MLLKLETVIDPPLCVGVSRAATGNTARYRVYSDHSVTFTVGEAELVDHLQLLASPAKPVKQSSNDLGFRFASHDNSYDGSCSAFALPYTKKSQTELAYIDTLVNLKIRLDSVKRMTQI